jgi:hypothetical protein
MPLPVGEDFTEVPGASRRDSSSPADGDSPTAGLFQSSQVLRLLEAHGDLMSLLDGRRDGSKECRLHEAFPENPRREEWEARLSGLQLSSQLLGRWR